MKNAIFSLFKRSSKFSGREILDLFIEFVYLLTIFLVPLWFAYLFPTYSIFEFNKLAVFQILLALLLLGTGLKFILYPSATNIFNRGTLKKYFLIPGIFIIGLSLTLLSSGNPTRSFFGSIERQAGLISYLSYFLWFLLLTVNLLTINNSYHVSDFDKSQDNLKRRINRLIISAVISSFIVSVYGILQVLNIDFLVWGVESPYITFRTISTFGQPNFLASWLLLVIPLNIYLFKISRRLLVKFFYLLIGLTQLICLLLTGSRAGLLALVFGAIIFLIYKIKSAGLLLRKKIINLLFILGILILIFFSFKSIYRDRLLTVTDLSSGSTAARVILYQTAIKAIIEKPLFGYGLENSSEVFIKYYTADWAVNGDVGQTADRAHNLILDILLTGGVFALVLYIGLYFYIFRLVKNNLRHNSISDITIALFLGIVMYLFSLLFGFAVVTGEIYFWLFFAILLVIAINKKITAESCNKNLLVTSGENQDNIIKLEKVNNNSKNKSVNSKLFKYTTKFVSVIFLMIIVSEAILKVADNLVADYYFKQITITLAQPDIFTSLVLYDFLKEHKPNVVNQQVYDNYLAERLSEALPSSNGLALKKVISDKLRDLDKSLPANSYSNLLVKAKINHVLKNYLLAGTYIDKLIELSPYWPQAYLEKGYICSDQGLNKDALVAYNLALLNLPDSADKGLNENHRRGVRYFHYLLYQRIANIFSAEKKEVMAEKYYQLAYKSNPEDYTILKKIADTYYLQGKIEEAIKYNLRGFNRAPQDYNWSMALGILYHEKGDTQTAINYINQALNLAPENKELLTLKTEYMLKLK